MTTYFVILLVMLTVVNTGVNAEWPEKSTDTNMVINRKRRGENEDLFTRVRRSFIKTYSTRSKSKKTNHRQILSASMVENKEGKTYGLNRYIQSDGSFKKRKNRGRHAFGNDDKWPDRKCKWCAGSFYPSVYWSDARWGGFGDELW